MYRVEHQGIVLGRLMFYENQWLALRDDVLDDADVRKVKAFYSREDALAWFRRDKIKKAI